MHLFVPLFIEQIFIEFLECANYSDISWYYNGKNKGKEILEGLTSTS